MFDIHSHIVFGVDDGACSLDESLRMLYQAEKVGIRGLIATPHYQENLFDMEKAADHFNELKYKASEFDVELKLGAEVFLERTLPEKLMQNRKLTLNGSRYILFDTPFGSAPTSCEHVLDWLLVNGYKPILAHPARNRYYMKNFHVLEGLVEKGCMLQLDAGCIAGVYGFASKNIAKRMLKQEMVHFVASNAHCAEDYEWMVKARKNLLRWVGEEYTERLLRENAEAILTGALEEKVI